MFWIFLLAVLLAVARFKPGVLAMRHAQRQGVVIPPFETAAVLLAARGAA